MATIAYGMKFSTDKGIRVWSPSHPRNHNGYVYEHILIAENILGKRLPPKAVVHHFDENNQNNKPNNLVICEDDSYHRHLHARQRILKRGGNPNLDKICSKCYSLKPRTEFFYELNRYDKLNTICKACVSARNKRIRDAKLTKKEI